MPNSADAVPWWPTVFALQEAAADSYHAAPVCSGLPRLYGGQVGAQSLLAAAATVDNTRVPHSSQTSFLHAGDDTRAISYDVDRVRDSRSMSTRVVTARQDGRMLATTVVSFHTAASSDSQASIEHEWAADHGDHVDPAPDPDTLPSRRAALADRYGTDIPVQAGPQWPVDLRYVDHVPWSDSVAPPRNRIWLKAIDYPRQLPGPTSRPWYSPRICPCSSRYTFRPG